MAKAKRIYFSPSPELRAYLKQLKRLGIYGSSLPGVVRWIVGKEVMRLLEKKVLTKVEVIEPEDDMEEEEDDEEP